MHLIKFRAPRKVPESAWKPRPESVEKPSFARTLLNMEVGYSSEEFTSAFETRENTTKSDPFHGFQQRLEGHTPP
ncbi:hypothetical protein GGC63_000999 [Paenibacillus sp. OAS669]|nr:hypothetical protein [Paenibacillus sp. OAS669]